MKKFIALVGVTVLSGLYVGSYLAMIRPKIGLAVLGRTAEYWRVPDYRINNVVTRTGYAPLAWLDQRIRPQYWHWEKRGMPRQPPSQPGGERR